MDSSITSGIRFLAMDGLSEVPDAPRNCEPNSTFVGIFWEKDRSSPKQVGKTWSPLGEGYPTTLTREPGRAVHRYSGKASWRRANLSQA